METQVGKTTSRRENSLLSRSYRALLWLQSSRPHLLSRSRRREDLFVLNCWPEGGWNDGEIDVIAVFFTCEIVITAAIVHACLLGFLQKSCPTHNCPGRYEHGGVRLRN